MRVTASKVGLLSHCAWSFRPEAEWVDTASAAADKGTRFHAAIASYVESGDVPALDEDIAALFVSARAWVDHFGIEQLRSEIAFAWDPATDTAEIIGQNIGRDYSAGGDRLCGSADIVAVSRATKVGFVGDWSSGDGSRKGPQLRALALMLARAEGLISVTVQSLEVDETGVRIVVDETLDAFELATVAGELAEGVGGIATSVPTPGEWCGKLYCNSRATCPAGDVAVAELLPPTALTRKLGAQIESPEHAVYMLDTIRLVEAKCAQIKQLIKAYVPEGGLLLPDGSVLMDSTRQMSRFDKTRALSVMRELGASEQQIESCTTVVTEGAGLKLRAAPKLKRGRAA